MDLYFLSWRENVLRGVSVRAN